MESKKGLDKKRAKRCLDSIFDEEGDSETRSILKMPIQLGSGMFIAPTSYATLKERGRLSVWGYNLLEEGFVFGGLGSFAAGLASYFGHDAGGLRPMDYLLFMPLVTNSVSLAYEHLREYNSRKSKILKIDTNEKPMRSA